MDFRFVYISIYYHWIVDCMYIEWDEFELNVWVILSFG